MDQPNDERPESLPMAYACPACGGALAPIEGSTNLLRCRACGGDCFAAEHAADSAGVDADSEPPAGLRDDELSARRIHDLAAARRATYRARSHCLIAAAACAVVIAQLAWMIASDARRRGWGLQCTGYALFAGLGVYGGIYFLARARDLHREAKRSSLTDPQHPPDFSTLREGEKPWERLEDVR